GAQRAACGTSRCGLRSSALETCKVAGRGDTQETSGLDVSRPQIEQLSVFRKVLESDREDAIGGLILVGKLKDRRPADEADTIDCNAGVVELCPRHERALVGIARVQPCEVRREDVERRSIPRDASVV